MLLTSSNLVRCIGVVFSALSLSRAVQLAVAMQHSPNKNEQAAFSPFFVSLSGNQRRCQEGVCKCACDVERGWIEECCVKKGKGCKKHVRLRVAATTGLGAFNPKTEGTASTCSAIIACEPISIESCDTFNRNGALFSRSAAPSLAHQPC